MTESTLAAIARFLNNREESMLKAASRVNAIKAQVIGLLVVVRAIQTMVQQRRVTMPASRPSQPTRTQPTSPTRANRTYNAGQAYVTKSNQIGR